ncbi:hypothetical protein LJC42_00360 [Eubacteriales bacterium OttesenSCG-928-K08]|nr:hypothetical protein [Eubacteriales bacterium OttesenSCG-928-K08]
MAIGEIIAVIVSISSAMVIFALQRHQNRRDKATDERAAARQKESMLMLSMMMANNKMSYATAIAVKGGKINGEMDEAMEEHLATKKAYYAFINDYAMTQLNGAQK